MTAPLASVARVTMLTHRYGDTTALDAVTVDIPAGRMVGLIGPDGVGKSSLLGLVAGAKKLQSGQVEVLGGDMGAVHHRTASYPRIASHERDPVHRLGGGKQHPEVVDGIADHQQALQRQVDVARHH